MQASLRSSPSLTHGAQAKCTRHPSTPRLIISYRGASAFFATAARRWIGKSVGKTCIHACKSTRHLLGQRPDQPVRKNRKRFSTVGRVTHQCADPEHSADHLLLRDDPSQQGAVKQSGSQSTQQRETYHEEAHHRRRAHRGYRNAGFRAIVRSGQRVWQYRVAPCACAAEWQWSACWAGG